MANKSWGQKARQSWLFLMVDSTLAAEGRQYTKRQSFESESREMDRYICRKRKFALLQISKLQGIFKDFFLFCYSKKRYTRSFVYFYPVGLKSFNHEPAFNTITTFFSIAAVLAKFKYNYLLFINWINSTQDVIQFYCVPATESYPSSHLSLTIINFLQDSSRHPNKYFSIDFWLTGFSFLTQTIFRDNRGLLEEWSVFLPWLAQVKDTKLPPGLKPSHLYKTEHSILCLHKIIRSIDPQTFSEHTLCAGHHPKYCTYIDQKMKSGLWHQWRPTCTPHLKVSERPCIHCLA